jgi:hypothetical protein
MPDDAAITLNEAATERKRSRDNLEDLDHLANVMRVVFANAKTDEDKAAALYRLEQGLSQNEKEYVMAKLRYIPSPLKQLIGG